MSTPPPVCTLCLSYGWTYEPQPRRTLWGPSYAPQARCPACERYLWVVPLESRPQACERKEQP